MRRKIDLLRLQILMAQAAIQYPAPWLKNATDVLRDQTGRFAKKAKDTVSQIGNTEKKIEQAIAEYKEDPDKFKNKIKSQILLFSTKQLEKLIKKDPALADKLTSLMFGVDAQTERDKLADLYKELNPELFEAIKLDPFQEIALDLEKANLEKLIQDLPKAVQLAGDKYNELLASLNNTQSDSEAIKILGKVIATSIPISVFLATTVAPEVLIPLLLDSTLAEALLGFAVSKIAGFAAGKAADALDIEDENTRFAIEIAAAIASNPVLQGLDKSVKVLAKNTGTAEELAKIGDAFVNVSKGKVKEALNIKSEGVSSYILSSIFDTPLRKLISLKKTYREGFKESARQAKEMAKTVKVPENIDLLKNGVAIPPRHITFVTGGFAGRNGVAGVKWGNQLRNVDDLFQEHHIVKFINSKFDIPDSRKVLNKTDLSISGLKIVDLVDANQVKLMLDTLLKEGRNPAAVELASNIYAYAQKYPQTQLNVIGHSAGGMIAQEAEAILKELGVDIKMANVGSPYWGFPPPSKKSITLTSKLDPVDGTIPMQNALNVDSVAGHFDYFSDSNARKILHDFFEGKEVKSYKQSTSRSPLKDLPEKVPQEVRDKAAQVLANKAALIEASQLKVNAAKLRLEKALPEEKADAQKQLNTAIEILKLYEALDEKQAIALVLAQMKQ